MAAYRSKRGLAPTRRVEMDSQRLLWARMRTRSRLCAGRNDGTAAAETEERHVRGGHLRSINNGIHVGTKALKTLSVKKNVQH